MAKMPEPIKTKSGRTILPAPRMESETVSPAKRRKQWGTAFADTEAREQVVRQRTLAQRCMIHADKMQGEGWYVTANVLAAAAEALDAADTLRKTLPSHWHDDAVTNFDDAVSPPGIDAGTGLPGVGYPANLIDMETHSKGRSACTPQRRRSAGANRGRRLSGSF